MASTGPRVPKTSRVAQHFDEIRAIASRRVRLVKPIQARWCAEADKLHARKWRLFAHSNHIKGFVCWARAAEEEMTDRELLGMSAHELGHIVADKLGMPAHVGSRFSRKPGTSQPVQHEADWVALEIFGLPIEYNSRTLQELL
jgi:hypothetical protein